MKYYTLKSNYVLRGWSNLHYALLDLDYTFGKRIIPLTEEQLKAIELMTSGNLSPEENIVPLYLKKATETALKNGYFTECEKGTGLEEYQKYHYATAKYTYALLWSITGNCNLDCKHCYIHSGENLYGELSLDQCDEVIRQCLEANINSIALTGGEPLVRRDFWELVDHILNNHIQILQIFTNGMLVDEAFFKELKKRKINPNYILLSFDGVGCHDWLRGIDGAEEAALRAIRLVKTNDIKVIVSMALHMGNIDSIFKTYERIKELGVDFWKAAPILNTGNWKEQPENQIDISKIYDRYLELLRLYKKDGFPMRLGLGGFFQGKPGEMETYKIPYVEGCGNCEREMDSLCEAAKISPYLLPNGKILPCIAMSGSMMEDIAPNIFEKDMNIEKALRNSQVEEYTKKTYQDLLLHNKECAECKDKYRCSGCRANALASGGFFEKDPYACVFIKGSYEEKIRKIMNE